MWFFVNSYFFNKQEYTFFLTCGDCELKIEHNENEKITTRIVYTYAIVCMF